VATARFRIYPAIAAFVATERRNVPFDHDCARAATLKNALEALGIPHTEIAAVRVNDAPATLERIVRDADYVEAWGYADTGTTQPTVGLDFVADAHLGGLARFLRMLGFDTIHANSITDADIRRLAYDERRVVLSRDRELLKCADVMTGCYVRAIRPEAQLREVACRFGLAKHARPFTRCLRCNTPLTTVDKSQVLCELPQSVARDQHAFYRCGSCNRIYWPGSHYVRMRAALERMLQ
jgi:uncharacterized protein with PIN domain/sulfur carrier protein ThiS